MFLSRLRVIARGRAGGAARAGVQLAAALYIAMYIVIAVKHLVYPFELEWMEGASVDHVRWILAGNAYYGPPKLAFTPFIYPPLYFYVSAGAAKVLGVSFFSMRLVSFLASIGCLIHLFRLARAETGRAAVGLLAAGLFAACYKEASAFYDIARVDSLFLFCFLSAVSALRGRGPGGAPSLRAQFAAIAWLLAMFLTKQSAPIAVVCLSGFALFRWRRQALLFSLGAPLSLGIAFLILHLATNGWFYYYAYAIPRQHPTVVAFFYDYWMKDLLAPLGVACLVTLFYFALRPPPREGAEASGSKGLFGAALLGALGMSYLGRLHAGGWPNTLMPAFAMLALTFGLGAHAIEQAFSQTPAHVLGRLRAAFIAVLAIQFTAMAYDPARLLPTKEDERAGKELVALIQKQEGDVLVLAHGSLGPMAGKAMFAHEMAMHDILGVDGGPPGEALKEEIAAALREQRFSTIVTDTDWYRQDIEVHYEKTREPFKGKDVFFPITGMKTRPRWIWKPRKPEPARRGRGGE